MDCIVVLLCTVAYRIFSQIKQLFLDSQAHKRLHYTNPPNNQLIYNIISLSLLAFNETIIIEMRKFPSHINFIVEVFSGRIKNLTVY